MNKLKEKQEMIEKLKKEFPHVNRFDCLNCDHSYSAHEHQLICLLHNKTVAETSICKNFFRMRSD